MITNDAHENEYLGAIAGMAETYGTATNAPAVGDFVSGLTAGRRWSGHVQAIECNRMVVEVAGAWLVVPVEDITH